LIVDDDLSLFKAYQEMFDSTKIEVLGVSTGKDALHALNLQKPDLVILDIMLPGGMNGFDVLEKIEASSQHKSIPVIVLTNLDSEEKVAKSIGAQKYFVKANTSKKQIVETVLKYLA